MAAVLSACTAAGSDAGPGTPTVVENEAPALGGERAWKVDSVPVLTVGAGDRRAEAGDTLYEFNDINGAKLLADGRIVVAVMGSHVLRFFDKSGTFVGSAGRKGDGPGEFRQILGLYLMRGDTIVVSDDHYDLEWFTPEGASIREGPARRAADWRSQTVGVLDDGRVIGVEFSHIETAGRVNHRMLLVLSLDTRSGAVDSLAVVPGIRHTAHIPGLGYDNVKFTPGAFFVALGDSLVTANSATYEFAVRSPAGGASRVVRRRWTADLVTPELKERHRHYYVNMLGENRKPAPQALRRQRERLLAVDPYPDSLPAFQELLASRDGDLWVQRYEIESTLHQAFSIGNQAVDVPAIWDVFDRSGRWLTTVELPARFTLLDVAGDRLLGLVQNEDEEQGIRVLRLVKP
jgi:hypothetical protein